MAGSDQNDEQGQARAGVFATTHWSVVLAAGQIQPDHAKVALEQLCHTYWQPLYVYVRRQGFDEPDAQDLTQEFFARLLASGGLGGVGREKGKFRTFLLASLHHFLANEWKRGHTLKRGGGITFLSLDELGSASAHYREPATELTPEKLYDRQWAQALLEHVLARLGSEYASAGKAALFDHLRVFLADAKGTVSYADAAGRVHLTDGAAKQAVRRLRQRYRELLRSEIAHTVSTPAEVEEEIQHLFAAFGS
jgi:RNA polymerase sigma-70 factor (ECF subfamily)